MVRSGDLPDARAKRAKPDHGISARRLGDPKQANHGSIFACTQSVREMRSGIAAAFIRPREAGESGGRLIQMSTPLNALLITSSSLVGLILIMHLAGRHRAGGQAPDRTV
jgi:hypothetical protein